MASAATPQLPPGHWGIIRGVAWSPDNRLLATASTDGTVLLWDARSGEMQLRLLGHRGAAWGVAWSPDGTHLATTGDDGTARIWNLQRPDEPPRILESQKGKVWGVAWSPDGTHLATASGDGTVRIWNPQRPDEAPRILEGHQGGVWGVAWNHDGTRIATAGDNGTARIWNCQRPDESPCILEGHKREVSDVAWSPDGTRLATASCDGTVRIWNPERPEEALRVLYGHHGEVWGVAWSSDGTSLATAGRDGTARIWNPQRPDHELRILEGHECRVLDVAWSPDGIHFATTSNNGTTHIWDLDQPDHAPRTLESYRDWVGSVAWSPDGTRLATTSEKGIARIWNPQRPDEPPRILKGHKGGVNGVTWNHDGTRIATAGLDGTVRIWNPQRPDHALYILEGHKGGARDVAWSPDGTRLATTSQYDALRIWDLGQSDHAPRILEGHQGGVWRVAWSPDGTHLATTSNGSTARVCIWDLDRPDEPPRILKGHKGWVTGATWNYDGTRIATAGGDGMVRIWDSNRLDEAPRLLDGHLSAINAVAWSSDGTRIATAGEDGTARIWNLERRICRVLLPAWGVGSLDGVGPPFWSTIDGEEVHPLDAKNNHSEPEHGTIAPRPGATDDRPIDHPDKDRLDARHYAKAIHHVLTHDTTRFPLTVAINAPWGTGKSSIARLLRHYLAPDHPICEFNAWSHDDKGALTPAFIRAVARTADRQRPFVRRALWPLPVHLWHAADLWQHLLAWAPTVVVLLLFTAWTLSRFVTDGEFWTEVATWAASGIVAFGFVGAVSLAGGVWMQLLGFLRNPAAIEQAGSIPAVREELQTLIDEATRSDPPWWHGLRRRNGRLASRSSRRLANHRTHWWAVALAWGVAIGCGTWLLAADLGRGGQWAGGVVTFSAVAVALAFSNAAVQTPRPGPGNPLVVFVDDLERCRPPHAVDVLEAIEQLFKTSNVAIVLLADMSLVASNVQVKYDSLARLHRPPGLDETDGETTGRLFGRQYVQKMVQVQLDVPRVARPAMENLMDHVLEGAVRREALAAFEKAAQDEDEGVLRVEVQTPPMDDTLPEEAGEPRPPVEPTRNAEDGPLDADTEQTGGSADATRAAPVEDAKGKEIREPEDAEEVRRRREEAAQAMIEDPNVLLRAAWAARNWLPGTPRSTKRLVNRLRITLYLCAVRGLLPGKVTERDVGLWCVLCERWPDLATVLQHHPATATRIQGKSEEVDAFKKEMHNLVRLYETEVDLHRFWQQPGAEGLAERIPYLVAFHMDPGPEFFEEAAERPFDQEQDGKAAGPVEE